MSKKNDFQKISPLSPMQERMLYHYLKDKTSTVCFEQDEMHLSGTLDIDLFEKSFNLIIQRYDILRTNFVYQKIKEPRQVVFKEKIGKIYFEDISLLEETEKLDYIKKFKDKDMERGFNLTKDILIRMTILKISEESYRLIWSYHHIIMDGWCLGIIFQDFVQIYKSLKEGTPLNLSKVYPYSNYIDWLQKQDRVEASDYWKKYIEDYKTQALPFGFNKLSINVEYVQQNKTFKFDSALLRSMEKIAKDCNVTINVVFQAIWGILLQRYNNSDDVVFGAVVSGRPPEVEGIEQMLGLFINTVPVRVKGKSNDIFVDIVKKLQKDVVSSRSYEYFPLAEIESHTGGIGELINNISIFENYPLDKEVINDSSQNLGFVLTNTESYSQTKYDLNIFLVVGESLDIRFSYNALVYNPEFINKMGEHVKKVLKIVTENPEVCVSIIDILTEDEKSQIIADLEQRDKMKDLRNNPALEYVSPTNQVEEKLVHIWQNVLNLEGVGINHNFFEIGGNSINVVRVMKLINEDFGMEVSVSELFKKPTIAEFANILNEDNTLSQFECAVSLNKISSKKKNVFVVHGMDGSAYLYKDLAKLLQEDCNFYGLQAKGMFDPSKMAQSVDEMVTDYIRDIKAIQPQGPYIIGGYCWGARLLYELVRRLEEQGDVIKKIIVLDEYAFIPRNRVRMLRLKGQTSKPFKSIKRILQKDAVSMDVWSDEYSTKKEIDNVQTNRTIQENIVYLCKKEYQYRGIVNADVYVIKADEHTDPRFSPELWREMTFGSVTYYHVPGQHLTIFEYPYVVGVADAMRKILNAK
ncbi:MAG: hypothetical protein KAX49_03120 [Halanaerobiales bacterium]|nr:hypothetical protein [Halanaerobiales bacterium]